MNNNDFLLYTFNKNYEYFEEVHHRLGAFSAEDVYFSTFNLLHSTLDYLDRMEAKFNIDENIIKAIRYANNALKHRDDMITLQEKTEGFTFPLLLSDDAIFYHYKWAESKLLGKGRYIDQDIEYKKFLEGEPVVFIFRDMYKLFNNIKPNDEEPFYYIDKTNS